uniref:Uncharacterized protein n=1 Tax=Anguilla anguilla TaxID=7936 RepID=A0A0E9RPN5_ANGAN
MAFFLRRGLYVTARQTLLQCFKAQYVQPSNMSGVSAVVH